MESCVIGTDMSKRWTVTRDAALTTSRWASKAPGCNNDASASLGVCMTSWCVDASASPRADWEYRSSPSRRPPSVNKTWQKSQWGVIWSSKECAKELKESREIWRYRSWRGLTFAMDISVYGQDVTGEGEGWRWMRKKWRNLCKFRAKKAEEDRAKRETSWYMVLTGLW